MLSSRLTRVPSRIVTRPDRRPGRGAGGEVRLSDVLSGLSYALDLTEGQRQGHAARSCLIGMRIGAEIGLPAAERQSLFYALLMKDLGCSSNAARFAALFAADDRSLKAALKTIDWTRALEAFRFVSRNVAPGAFWLRRVWQMLAVFSKGPEGVREVVRTRCERGADMARLLGFSSDTVQAIRTLDEHWNGQGQPYGLRGEQIPLLGRILGLAQTVEVFAGSDGPQTAVDVALARRGRWFDPDLVDALQSVLGDTAFWDALRQGDPIAQVAGVEPTEVPVLADDDALDEVAEAFARVIDAKSPWTYRHSNGVADIALLVGQRLGLAPGALRGLKRAALLHDLGKLGVSNLILDKPGPLADGELASMRQHPAHTYEILRRVGCFRHLAGVAAAHHERLDGRGYHLGLEAGAIPPQARILCVADVCDALRTSRPYRAGLQPDRVLDVMKRDVGAAIDPVCFAALQECLGGTEEPPSYTAPAVNLIPALAEDYHQAA
jgi:HD-GYP domain-containing protein (c-di-GMP phosphodiesterase class II)